MGVASITEDYKGTQYQEDHEVYDQPSPYISWTWAFADTPVPPCGPVREFEGVPGPHGGDRPLWDRDFLRFRTDLCRGRSTKVSAEPSIAAEGVRAGVSYCALCDMDIQPYLTNPINRAGVERYLSHEQRAMP